MNINTTVNSNLHKIVVVLEGNALGFTSLGTAVSFLEEVYCGEETSKLFNAIATAMSDDKADDLQIFDIETYADLFMDDVDDEDADA